MKADRKDPFKLFGEWFARAEEAEPVNPNAVALATADGRGIPSLRMVLLKGWGADGFVFYTNLESHKGQDLAENPNAALCFYWKSLGRQIRIEGTALPVSVAEADDYFASRPRDSRIGAWASRQSRVIEGPLKLEREVAKYAAKYALGSIPRPPCWSGFRVQPKVMEFWQERPFRLHHRQLFRREGEGWVVEILYP
jgi:pyridoxamine 5'-phosphate oxidase